MNLKINSISSANYYHKNISFNSRSRNLLRKGCYALITAAMLTSAACTNKNKADGPAGFESSRLISAIDSLEKESRIQNIYHYFPTEDGSISNAPDWSEKVYPDGRVEIDSLNYKISVDADGEKTVVKTETDSVGNTTITTNYPDNTKTIHTIYKLNNPKEKLESEKTYWASGKLKESKLRKEYPSDSTENGPEIIITQNYKRFNENEVLLYWETINNSAEKDNSNDIYDEKHRIIHDYNKNESYQYKGDEVTPFRSVSELEGCKRITLYNDSGDVKKIYFEASDGTITEK